ncbi:HEAT repeat domain-containing protein [Archangium lansingense]|uniref:HEAT repeat domain-containing protein n=1 Tax=Archangium lansingense TaxID=2995310 RepID=A0ABT3ZWI1_9BACT|nr:HEAT repeat domain-containing protein [Archangium lansinium]MCY1073414.1 HEAT repeat domain-containing protein [Archangium lansinium]
MRAKKKWVGLGAGLIAVLAGLGVWRSGRTDGPSSETPVPVAPTAPAPASASKSPPPEDMLRPVPCELDSLVEEYRQGKGSPAWRRYVVEQLRGLLESLPPEQLWAKVEAEQDPEVLEALSALWVMRFNPTGDRSVLERVLDKAGREPDPVRKAGMVRALRALDAPASVVLAMEESTRQAYRQWVKDPAPEVREAVVGNLTEEARRIFERSQSVAEQAVTLASEAGDPKTAAGLLGASSIEAARTPAVDSVRRLLQESEHPEVRAAAAKALGTVSVKETGRTMQALNGRFATEREREVRSAILESISRLGLASAVPVLQKLKGVDPSMDGEIDTWLTLLASQPQTWNLLLRDKQALEHGRGQEG